MPNSNLTRESGTDNSDHAGAGRSGQSNPTEGPTAPPRNPDGPPEANRHRLPMSAWPSRTTSRLEETRAI